MGQTVVNIESKLKDAANCRKEGDFALAASIYQNLLEQQPDNASLHNKLGQVKAQAQDWQGAIASYQRALELGIEAPFWTYKNLGDALREIKQFDQAIAVYRQAIKIESTHPNVYDSLGQVYSWQGNYQDAISAYQQAIELGISNPYWTYQNMGNALTKENRLDEAQAAYQQAQKLKSDNFSESEKLQDNLSPNTPQTNSWLEIHNQGDKHFLDEEWEQAISSYQQAIKLNPDYFWSWYNLGRAWACLTKWSEAIICYQQANKLDASQSSIVDQHLEKALERQNSLRKLQSEFEVEECLREADNHFRQGHLTQAILRYQKVINTKPEIGKSVYQNLGTAMAANKYLQAKAKPAAPDSLSADQHYQKGEKSLQSGEINEAISSYQKAIEVNPAFAVAYRALGDVYKQQNLLQDAAEHYRKSVQLKPNYCHAYQRLADVLYKQGELTEAITAYRKCLKINSSQPEVHKKLTDLLKESGQIPETTETQAFSSKEDIVAQSPDEYYVLGEAYYKQGKLDLAAAAHQKALELNPNLALSYRALGDIYSRKNQQSQAIESYRQAVELKPDYYYGYQRLGKVLQEQGKPIEAISAYRRALEINPCIQELQHTLKDLLRQENMLPPSRQYNQRDYPRVLVVAPIKFNQQAGGGVTMGNLFRGWPQEAIAQIHSDMFTEADYSVCSQYFYLPRNKQQLDSQEIPLKTELLSWCKLFQPDIIFARPIDQPMFYWWLPQALSAELGIPFVTNIMDDWPARYEARDDLAEGDTSKLMLQQNLQEMFDGAAANIAISPQMCEAYEQRYKNQFVPFHNCIDVAEWSKVVKSYEIKGEFTLLYLGVVTEDKELWSLKNVRDTVLTLREQGYPVKMQIYSAPFCCSTIEKHLESKPTVEYAGYVHPSKLPQVLSEADLLILPINFDPASLKYVGYSIQTKVPEYMASGTPILAYGPAVSPNIDYALRENWGIVVDQPDKQKLESAIIALFENLELRSRLGNDARNLAFRNHDAHKIRNSYRQLLADVAWSN